ncbi:DUF3226 domain-containing protein [Sorangium sp. So ce1024]|uniref:DUF3226 domain-containing protein n=1 Tax=unclassified Sorangium TaxID=2621164 RepID=UPI003F02957A
MSAPRAAPRGESRNWSLDSDKLILVEGRDEEEFFRAMLRHLARDDVQVKAYGGKPSLRTFIPTLVTQPRFPELDALIVVRDADHQPPGAGFQTAWNSVCGVLSSHQLVTPRAHGAFQEGKPRVAIFIMPDGASDGMLEDLCCAGVSADPASPLVDRYLLSLAEELKKLDEANDDRAACLLRDPHRRAKAWAHAFLSSRREPDKRVGEAAWLGFWPFDAPAFAPLMELLRQI